jgi:phosphate starvation-inducible PhoH-like protein
MKKNHRFTNLLSHPPRYDKLRSNFGPVVAPFNRHLYCDQYLASLKMLNSPSLRSGESLDYPSNDNRRFFSSSVRDSDYDVENEKWCLPKEEQTKKNKKQSFLIKPKNKNQKLYYRHLHDKNVKIVVGVGPAGTGKTLFACVFAINELINKRVDKIIITRPLVSVDEENVGFLPGSMNEKMDPWTRPIIDIFQEYCSLDEIQKMILNRKIEIIPLAYMRGRTFKNSIIIADEMQNSSPNQMFMLTTRIGEESKMIITGDLKQTDRSGINGLSDFIDKIKLWESYQINFHKNHVEGSLLEIVVVEFGKSDIERSPIVSKIMDIYSKEGKLMDSPEAVNSPSLHSGEFSGQALPTKVVETVSPERSDGKTNSTSNGNDDASLFPKHYLTKNIMKYLPNN